MTEPVVVDALVAEELVVVVELNLAVFSHYLNFAFSWFSLIWVTTRAGATGGRFGIVKFSSLMAGKTLRIADTVTGKAVSVAVHARLLIGAAIHAGIVTGTTLSILIDKFINRASAWALD